LLCIFCYIPAAALCGVCISQFVQYSRTCGSDYAFLDREFLLARNILKQGFLVVNLNSPFPKNYYRAIMNDLVNLCERSVLQITTDMFRLSYSHPVLSLLMTYHPGCNKINTICAICRAETAPRHFSSPLFWWSCWCFLTCLYCLSFFHLRLLITSLISSKCSSVHRKSNDLQLVFQISTYKRWTEYQDSNIPVSDRI
jgi:hypothetical protein